MDILKIPNRIALVAIGFTLPAIVILSLGIIVVEPLWPLVLLLIACVLTYAGAVVYTYRRGARAYYTHAGLKIWWFEGTTPLEKNYIDSRIFKIHEKFCNKAGILHLGDRAAMFKYLNKITLHVKNGRIHSLEEVIGLSYPGINSTFQEEYFDSALDHEMNLHLCHFLFPNRTEEEDVKWMLKLGIA